MQDERFRKGDDKRDASEITDVRLYTGQGLCPGEEFYEEIPRIQSEGKYAGEVVYEFANGTGCFLYSISRQHRCIIRADRILCALHQQVNLIRHAAVSIEAGRAVLPSYPNRCDELQVILQRVKDELAVITSRDDVIESAFNF